MNRRIAGLARAAALAGGAILLALIAMTCVSILGRAGLSLGRLFENPWLLAHLRPIRGDYELIEAGSAIAICAFLPLSVLARAHASVDLTRGRLPAWLDRALDLAWDVLMAGALLLLAWQMGQGMLTKRASTETTFLLQWPVWWAYAACLGFTAIAALVAMWVALARPGAARLRDAVE